MATRSGNSLHWIGSCIRFKIAQLRLWEFKSPRGHHFKTMTTTSKIHSEQTYTLNITNDIGVVSERSKDYICGLMRISGNRNKLTNLALSKKRLELAQYIRTDKIPESEIFYLKGYISKFYPCYKNKITFSKNYLHPLLKNS